jgi:hypothetical protein
MRRASKRVAGNTAMDNARLAKSSRLKRDQVARIRERREEIRRRAGVLSDSANLIREDRDR